MHCYTLIGLVSLINFVYTSFPIYDKDEEKITKLLPPEDKWEGMRLKYIKLDEKTTIGEKRNIGIENACHRGAFDQYSIMKKLPFESILNQISVVQAQV